MDAFAKAIKGINQKVKLFPLSCTTGEGVDDWVAWLLKRVKG
jgi:Ni2+-binding GTPase involved in maturation of urease and hydrogenase